MLSRAEKGRLQERIALDARTLRLSNATVAWFLDRATPGQMQAVSELLSHELEVRRDSKHARLLRQARFPAVKSVRSSTRPTCGSRKATGGISCWAWNGWGRGRTSCSTGRREGARPTLQ